MAKYEVTVIGEKVLQCYYSLDVEADSFEEAEKKAMKEVETGEYDYLAEVDTKGSIQWSGTYIQ